MVLFVPSMVRDGETPIDQERWLDLSLEMFGRVFGGATAYPKAKGIWRDDERGGVLVKDEPVVVHCYTTATRRRPRLRISATSPSLGASAGRWDARLAKGKSALSSATSISQFVILESRR